MEKAAPVIEIWFGWTLRATRNLASAFAQGWERLFNGGDFRAWSLRAGFPYFQ